jgi:hypothetical protein
MQAYLYVRGDEPLVRLGTSREAIRDVLAQVIPDRAAHRLVVAVALVPGTQWSGRYERWQTPETWLRLRGHWKRSAGLKKNFQLVRIVMGQNAIYPYEAPDVHGWTWRFDTFEDQLAAVLAHEIAHVEGPPLPVLNVHHDEQRANAFALAHTRALDFHVQGAPDGR